MDVLAGMHDIPWAALQHCFGASDDLPDLLSETAAGAAEALEELGGYMVHRLRELATQDRRIVDSGHVQAFIHDDDELRAAILGLIGDVAATALSSALWITRAWWLTWTGSAYPRRPS